AKILHHEGARGLHAFDTVHCEDKDFASLSERLFGPDETKCVFTSCKGGTILLHEISALSFDFQKRLLDVLRDKGIPGSRISMDARIIASTTKDLGKMVDEGEFNRDLYEFLSKAY